MRVSQAAGPTGPASAPVPPAKHHAAFHRLLSELNPLQYVPVLGTIYRAVTGDTIPDTARLVGSLVVGFLTGGPVGVAIGIGTALLEHETGIDPERIATRLLARAGLCAPHEAAAALQPEAVAAARSPAALAWSPSQLRAYGVSRSADGTLSRAALNGADVLNGLELSRLRHLVA